MDASRPLLTTASELLRQLSPDEIRERLKDLEAEAKALRVLLRVAVKSERLRPTGGNATPPKGARDGK
jgi:hypothetical protein